MQLANYVSWIYIYTHINSSLSYINKKIIIIHGYNCTFDACTCMKTQYINYHQSSNLDWSLGSWYYNIWIESYDFRMSVYVWLLRFHGRCIHYEHNMWKSGMIIWNNKNMKWTLYMWRFLFWSNIMWHLIYENGDKTTSSYPYQLMEDEMPAWKERKKFHLS